MKALAKVLLVPLLLIGATASAQGYVLAQSSQAYVPMTGGTAVTFSSGLDEGSAVVPLGFTFKYGGMNYQYVSISANGSLELVASSSATATCKSYSYAGPFPVTCGQNVIAPWWGDLKGPSSGGGVKYTSASGTFTVEYQSWGYFLSAAPGRFSFMVKFVNSSATGNDRVEVYYGDHTAGSGDDVVAGIQLSGTGYPFLACSAMSAMCHAPDWPANTMVVFETPPGPELTVSALEVNGFRRVTGGAELALVPQFWNMGQTGATGVHWRAYLSADEQLSGDDLEVFNSATSSNGPSDFPANMVSAIPVAVSVPGLSNGRYYTLVMVDAEDTVVEVDEQNNLRASKPDSLGADVHVSFLGAVPQLVTPGATSVGVDVTLTNVGTDDAVLPWALTLSTDKVPSPDDLVLATGNATVLARVAGTDGGVAIPLQVSFDIPATGVGGFYNLGFMADPGQVTSDVDRTNNLAFASSPLRINTAPVGNPQNVALLEDSSVDVQLSAQDGEGDVLSFSVVIGPQHGSLAPLSGNLYRYTPGLNFHGADTFTFEVNDGAASSQATVHLDVQSTNDMPVAGDLFASTQEDTPLTLDLSTVGPDGGVVSDVDGTALTVLVDTLPSHGAITLDGTSVTYTPAPDFAGGDSFTYRVTDGALSSTIATVQLDVTPVSDAPVAAAQALSVPEDGVRLVSLSGADADGDSLSFELVRLPLHGTLTGAPPVVLYLPKPNFYGTDSFEFRARDGARDSAPATVTLTVTPVNDVPTSTGQVVTVSEDLSKAFSLDGADLDGDSLTLVVDVQPRRGTLSGTFPALTYTPSANFSGTDTFSYRLTDGVATSSAATVVFDVVASNDPPSASIQAVAGREDQVIVVALHGTDADGDALTFKVETPPANGTLVGNPPYLAYYPNPDFSGADSFTFRASDGALESAPATVSFVVDPVNDAPRVGRVGDRSVSVGESVIFTIQASDIDGTVPLLAMPGLPPGASFDAATGLFSWTPGSSQVGVHLLTIDATDGVATVSENVVVSVIAVPDLPARWPWDDGGTNPPVVDGGRAPEPDAGMPDAGVDAGPADAGVVTEADAGMGGEVPGDGPGGSDGGVSQEDGNRNLFGCSASGTPGAVWPVFLGWAWARRRRDIR